MLKKKEVETIKACPSLHGQISPIFLRVKTSDTLNQVLYMTAQDITAQLD